MKIYPLNLTANTDKLKQLILENPDMPIVVLAGEEANSGDYYYMYCGRISFGIREILDCECPYDEESVCADREEFEERFEEWLWDKMCYEDSSNDGVEPTEEEFQARLKDEMSKYEPYWKKVIAICADN